MNRAAIVLLSALCLWVGANLWFRTPVTDPTALFMDDVGESWFGAYLAGEKIGYARFVTERGADYRVSSHLTLRLPTGSWYHATESKQFDVHAPHALQRFERVEHSDSSEERLVIEPHADGGYRATITQPSGTRHLPVELEHDLADQVGLRRWLESDPRIGSIHELRDIDVERLVPLTTRWQLVAADAGFVLEGIGEGIDRRTVLDGEHRLLELEIGGGLSLRREPQTKATLMNPAVKSTSSGPRLDRSIGGARYVRRLVLELNPAAAEAFDDAPGQQLSTFDDATRLTLDRSDKAFETRAVRQQDSLAETVGYPRTPAIAQLSMQAVGDAMDNRQRALRLTQFVHQYLDYRDATSALTVDDIVEGREGDCTEYAELFTTLARAIGLPARTVSGLVYRDEKGDRLVLHAWNEVVIDDHWFSVDPTWNEFGIDAAHLRFPLQPDRLMRAHGLLPQMRFKVIEVDSG